MMKLDTLKKIALVLIIIGAINWALVGLFEVDLVALILGSNTHIIAKIIYILIGISGLLCISNLFREEH